MAGSPNIVLVHGAWADGSCWSEVIERLQADGYEVHARLDTIFFGPAKSRYGEAAWDAAGTEGAALSLPDAIAYALEEAPPPQ